MLSFKDLKPFILSFIILSMVFMFGIMSFIIDIKTNIIIIHPVIALQIIIGSIGLLATSILGLEDIFKTQENANKKEEK